MDTFFQTLIALSLVLFYNYAHPCRFLLCKVLRLIGARRFCSHSLAVTTLILY